MKNVLNFLSGYRTYIIAALAITAGVLQGLDIFVLPEWAWVVIGGLGLTTLRLAVSTIAQTVKDVANAVKSLPPKSN